MAKNDRKNNAFPLRRVKTAAIVVSLFLMIAWAAAPLTTRVNQGHELVTLKKRQRQVRREHRRLQQDIERLKTDEAYWEELARKNLGYIKSGEEAYIVIEEKSAPVKKKPRPEPGLWEQLKVSINKALPF